MAPSRTPKLQMKSSSGSKSPAAKGPDEAELKMLRARYRNSFQKFASGVAKNSSNPSVKGGQVRVKAAKRHSQSPIVVQQALEDETPTVFEEIGGKGLKPAKTKLRHRNIFRKPDQRKTSESGSDASVKKVKHKPVKPQTAVAETRTKEKSPIEPEKKEEKQAIIGPTVGDEKAKEVTSTPPVKEAEAKTSPVERTKLGQHKGKRSLFEQLGEEIVLDDRVLRDIADDIGKGIQHNPDLINPQLASQLAEIKQNQAGVTDADLQEASDQPFEVNETANRVVESLTSQEVLGQVLDTNELRDLSEYFNGIRQQDEELLAVLDGALEKILERAGEFYSDRKELKGFLENRDTAKLLLLDALLSRKSGFLSQLYSNAFYYADVLKSTVATACKTVSDAYVVANVVAGQSVAAASDGIALASDAFNRSADAARELAQRSQEYVTTAKEVGRGIVDGATAAADYARSLTNLATEIKQASFQHKDDKISGEEHWLTTLWKVLSSLAHLPYAFFDSSEENAEKANDVDYRKKGSGTPKTK